MNKNRIRPRIFVRIQVGHQLKLGNSTRAYILTGPSEDEEEESEFTVTELKQQRVEREIEKERLEQEEKLKQTQLAKAKENEGISWGMAEDAEDEPDLSENPYAVTNNEELFLDDPKKTLRGYFEREGHDLNYRCDELSPGVYICRIDLPLDDEFGNSIVCEVQHKGKKKECVLQCALEACRILDRHGVLRQSHHEPRRAKKYSESDSDDDLFFDRTGDVEKKRLKKVGQQQSQEALTYEQLTSQEEEIVAKISSLEIKLDLMIENERRQKQQQEASEEDLDSFMSQLSHDKIDKFGIRNTKMELQNLKIEQTKIQKLINIAKPSVSLPPVNLTKGKLPLFGKRKNLSKNFGVKKMEVSETKVGDDFSIEVEEEEETPKLSKSVIVEVSDQKSEKKIPQEKLPVPEEISEKVEKISKLLIDEPEPLIKKQKLDEPDVTTSLQAPTTSQKKKPRNSRSQNRYRANVDMNDDDEYIDEDKVSMWVAPDTQKGDGMTHLNDKYGY